MRDTPRTDAALVEPRPMGSPVPDPVAFARQLEREMAEAIACKVTAERLLNEAEEKLTAISEGVEKLANQLSGFERLDGDKIANELRALLK